MEFLNHKLDNGLEVIAECNDRAYSAAIGFFVKTGSRDETEPLAGVSHFLEHMAFKGTAGRTVDQVNREFDAMGAHYNACTSEEQTVYYAAVLPECIDRVVELWTDLLRPSLREEDFETEKQVILEEIFLYRDMPPFGADDRCKELYFGDHPLGKSVLGTVDSITQMDAAAMRDYFGQKYGANRIVLVACGNVDFDHLLETAQRRCGDWTPGDDRISGQVFKPNQQFLAMPKESATQQYTMQLAPGPKVDDPLRYAAKVLATILGDETGSRMYWEFIDSGRAEHISFGHGEYDDTATFSTYLGCDPELADDNLQRLDELFRKARNEGVTKAELDQAKSKILSRVVLGAERPRDRLFGLGNEWILRHKYESIEDDLREVRAITLDQVNRVLADYPLTQNTTVTIGPVTDWSYRS